MIILLSQFICISILRFWAKCNSDHGNDDVDVSKLLLVCILIYDWIYTVKQYCQVNQSSI